MAALVDALIPETPELSDRGAEHVPGGLETDMDEAVLERLNTLVEAHGRAGLVTDTMPMAPVVATLLELAAVELVVRRRGEDGLESPDERFSRGVFSRLSREDRLRAVGLLEDEGTLARLADRLDSASLGEVRYLAGSLQVLVAFTYYSGAAEEGEGRPLGWRQSGYPGPAEGYAVGRGYELEAFEENEY
jgi:hypothetical protein